jgi:hypothetical protein
MNNLNSTTMKKKQMMEEIACLNCGSHLTAKDIEDPNGELCDSCIESEEESAAGYSEEEE